MNIPAQPAPSQPAPARTEPPPDWLMLVILAGVAIMLIGAIFF